MNDETSFVSSDDTDGIEGSGKVKVLDALLQEIRAKAPKDKVVIVSNFTSSGEKDGINLDDTSI